MNLYSELGLRRVINAYDKATSLGGARVQPEIAEVVAAALPNVFELGAMQDAAGRAVAEATGAEWGCVVSCAAAGITLGVAACMTGKDPARVAQLPDTEGMVERVIIQKGHCVSFGAPVPQMIRLSGATLVEVGLANGCKAWHVEHELAKSGVAAVFAVESYHTADYRGVKLPELAEIAHAAGVPLVVDCATQELRLRELVATSADLITCSAQKYLGSVTAGVIAGRRDLVEAVRLQHGGIGRGMKSSKAGILGVVAAFRAPMWTDREAWVRRERAKIARIVERLGQLDGLDATISPDPNGCPLDRARLRIDPEATGHTAVSLRQTLITGDPAIYTRIYDPDEGCVYLNATEMTDDEVDVVCERIEQELRSP